MPNDMQKQIIALIASAIAFALDFAGTVSVNSTAEITAAETVVPEAPVPETEAPAPAPEAGTVIFHDDLGLLDNASLPPAVRAYLSVMPADETGYVTLPYESIVAPGQDTETALKALLRGLKQYAIGYTTIPSISCSLTYDGAVPVFITMSLKNCDPAWRLEYASSTAEIHNLVTGEMGVQAGETYESALEKINSWLCENIVYDLDYAQKPLSAGLHDRRGTCMLYASVLERAADYCGIDCDIVVDQASTHGWNRVFINGGEFYIDPTWNAARYQATGRQEDKYAWFLLSYSQFMADHNE